MSRVTGEICILAGGLSARMGRDKSRLRLRGRTLLCHVRDAAEKTGWPVRLIRRDLVARCGPLGGIYTALKTTAADRVLFLACDMPFVTPKLLETLMAKRGNVFVHHDDLAGFPFILSKTTLPKMEQLLAEKSYSLQALATRLKAGIFAPKTAEFVLFNVNSPQDWTIARSLAF